MLRIFLTNHLPRELVEIIDMNTLEPQLTSYIDEKLKEQFADLLFRVNIMEKEAYIYFLFEHKSYRDRMVTFQVLKYMIAVWEAKIKENLSKIKEENLPDTGEMEIPIVIPLIVYHNKDKWNVKRTLGDMIPNFMDLPDIVKKYIPNFEYILSDLSYSEDTKDINLDEEHSIVVRILNRTRYASKDELIEVFTKPIILFTKTKDKDMVGRYITESTTYILGVRDDISEKELIEIAGKISEEGGELVMTAAEKLRKEGMDQGIKKGIKKGRKEGQRLAMLENVLTLLSLKFGMIPSSTQQKLSQLDTIALKSIISEIFRYESLDEINKYLK